MVYPLKTIKILGPGVEPVIRHLRKELSRGGKLKREEAGRVVEIKIDQGLEPNDYEVHRVNEESSRGPVILKLGENVGKQIVEEIPTIKGIKDKEDNAYIIDATGKFLGLTEHEEAVHESLKTFDDILGRAYNRRTNVSSWLLFLALRYYGFYADDYKPIHKILTGSTDKPGEKPDTSFIVEFAKYLKIKDEEPKKVQEFLDSAFKGDPKKQQKLGLLKMANLFMNCSKKLSTGFIDKFPLIFYFQNLAMPILSRAFDKTIFGKIFKAMLIINPWIGDFFSEILANFKTELIKLNEEHASVLDPFKDTKTKQDINGAKINNAVIDKVELTSLDKEQDNLKKVVHTVSNVFERLFGRGNNLTSLILNAVLRIFRGKKYSEFSEEFEKNNNFVRNLDEHLRAVKTSIQDKTPEPELPKDKFTGDQPLVARVAVGVVSLANSMTPKFIRITSNLFGGIFSVQNLFMPILAEIFHKGKIGTTLRIVRDINPWLNDFVDYVANFRKEILDVQEVNKNIPNLLPKLTKDKLFSYTVKNVKFLFSSIKSFGQRVFIPLKAKVA